MLARQHDLEDLHHLDRALVTRDAGEGLAGEVGRNDVDRQPPAEDAVERRDAARELRRPVLACAHRPQEPHLVKYRRDCGGEHRGVEPERIA
jgi:hypothetical protein